MVPILRPGRDDRYKILRKRSRKVRFHESKHVDHGQDVNGHVRPSRSIHFDSDHTLTTPRENKDVPLDRRKILRKRSKKVHFYESRHVGHGHDMPRRKRSRYTKVRKSTSFYNLGPATAKRRLYRRKRSRIRLKSAHNIRRRASKKIQGHIVKGLKRRVLHTQEREEIPGRRVKLKVKHRIIRHKSGKSKVSVALKNRPYGVRRAPTAPTRIARKVPVVIDSWIRLRMGSPSGSEGDIVGHLKAAGSLRYGGKVYRKRRKLSRAHSFKTRKGHRDYYREDIVTGHREAVRRAKRREEDKEVSPHGVMVGKSRERKRQEDDEESRIESWHHEDEEGEDDDEYARTESWRHEDEDDDEDARTESWRHQDEEDEEVGEGSGMESWHHHGEEDEEDEEGSRTDSWHQHDESDEDRKIPHMEEALDIDQADEDRSRFQEEEDTRLRRLIAEENLARSDAKNDPSVDLGATFVSSKPIAKMRDGIFGHIEDSSTSVVFYDWEKPPNQERIGFHVRKKVSDYNQLVEKLSGEATWYQRRPGTSSDASGYGGQDKLRQLQQQHDEQLKKLQDLQDELNHMEENNLPKEDEIGGPIMEELSRSSPTKSPVDYYDSENLASEDDIGTHVLKKRDDYDKMLDSKFRSSRRRKSRVKELSRSSPTKSPVDYYDSENLASEDEIGAHVLKKRDDYDKMLDSKFRSSRRRKSRVKELSRSSPTKSPVDYYDSEHLASEDEIGSHVRHKKHDYEGMLTRKFGDKDENRPAAKDSTDDESITGPRVIWENFKGIFKKRFGGKKEKTKEEKAKDEEDKDEDDNSFINTLDESSLPSTVAHGPSQDTSAVPYYESDDLASEDEIGHNVQEKKHDYEGMLHRKYDGSTSDSP